jgi:hypothetical protein
VRPLLSELQVRKWQELAKDRPKWRKMLKSIRIRRYFVLQVQGVGSFARRYRVDQPRTQIKRKGDSGGDLQPAAPQPPPQRGAFAQHAAGVIQGKAEYPGETSVLRLFSNNLLWFGDSGHTAD